MPLVTPLQPSTVEIIVGYYGLNKKMDGGFQWAIMNGTDWF